MMILVSWLFLNLLTFAHAASPVPEAPANPVIQDGWEYVSRFGEIDLYKKEIKGSDILAYRGSGRIHAPMDKLVSVIVDTERKKEWMERVKEIKTLQTLSRFERVEYMRVGVPWPFQERDFIYRAKMSLDPAHKTVVIELSPAEDSSKPPTSDRTRGIIYSAKFTLVGSNDGQDTQIKAEAHADPKGIIPAWVINLLQRSWPKKSLERVMRQVSKPDIVPFPEVEAFFKKP